MYPSNIRKRILNNELLLGTAMFSIEPHITSIVCQTKPDWLWIDTEHAPWGIESVGMSCIMARQNGIAGVIRIPWNTPSYIKKAYDVGAVGVMIPQVDTPEEVADAVRFGKYPPVGERGIAPWFAGHLGATQDDVIQHANDETMLILQMESLEAWENIDEILKNPNFEVILVGPSDLSASLGVPGQTHHPKVENIMVDLAAKMKGTNKALATTFGEVEHCKRWISEGYRMMNIGSVLGFGISQTTKIFQELREEFGP